MLGRVTDGRKPDQIDHQASDVGEASKDAYNMGRCVGKMQANSDGVVTFSTIFTAGDTILSHARVMPVRAESMTNLAGHPKD